MNMFAQFGPGTFTDLKIRVDGVEAFLGLLFNDDTRLIVKMIDLGKMRMDATEFRRFYDRWPGALMVSRLEAEVHEIFEYVTQSGGEGDRPWME